MGTIMQRLRNSTFNQTFIILQRQPEENNSQDETSLDESNVDDGNSKDCQEDFEAENLRTGPINKELSLSECNKMQQNVTDITIPNREKLGEKSVNRSDTLKSSELKEFEVYLTSLLANIKCENSLETRCSSVLNLAVCLVSDSPDVEIQDCLEALKNLQDSHDFPPLAVCHALLLCAFTKMSMSLKDLLKLEKKITSLTKSLNRGNIMKKPEMFKIGVLIEEHGETTLKLSQEMFHENYLDLKQIDILTICCCSLYNLSSLAKQFETDLGKAYNFNDSTLKFILGMTGRSTQEIVSENRISSNQKYPCPSMSSHRLKQCLQVLEHALTIDPDLIYREALHHESSSLPHCLTRLLGWSVSSVFPVKDSNTAEEIDSNYFTFHLTTLVCILKILSIMTFDPDQYDSFSNVKGLMEKILICTLKAYFESEKNHFDIQILCLEMLINLYIKNEKTFVMLCLKKFRISDTEEILAVEALLKMLYANLEKIKEVKERYPQRNNKGEPSENSVEESGKGTVVDVSKEDLAKKPRKEKIDPVSKDDFIKKPRKEADGDMSNEDPIKKPRKETVTDKLTVDLSEKHGKETTEEVPCDTPKEKSGKETTPETDAVLQAASKDMEHSTIVSFICVLIVFFMRTRQNFKEFILERLSTESLKEATVVSKKFLEFASLTGGMPVTGIIILTQTINKLQSLQSS